MPASGGRSFVVGLTSNPFAFCAVLAGAARADVLVVQPGNPAAFPQIQAAIDSAHDGDVVLVKSGSYTTFQVLDKALWIVADTGASVNVAGAARVRGLAAARDVVLAGLSVTGEFNAFDAQRHGLFVHNCAGSVRLLDCTFRGASGSNTGCVAAHGAFVQASADVAFSACTLVGRGPDYVTGHGLEAVASSIALYGCSARGGDGGVHVDCSFGYGDGGDAGDGVHLADGAFAFASRSTLAGGTGGAALAAPSCDFCNLSGDGGSGVAGADPATPTEVLVSLDVVASSGPSGSCAALLPCWPWCVTTLAGQQYCGGIRPAPIDGLVAHTMLAGSGRELEAPRVAREGTSWTITLRGAPGDEVELFFGERTSFDYLPTSRGVLVARTRRPQPVLLAGTLPGSGVLTVNVPVNDLGAGVLARTLFVQALHHDTSGTPTLGGFASVLLLDSSL